MQGSKRLVGKDRVILQETTLIIDSKADMPDWYARQYRHVAIKYKENYYYVIEKQQLESRRYRYILELWPADLHDLPGKTIEYDVEYTQARDSIAATIKRANQINQILTPFSPILGLLPEWIKLALEEKFGLNRWNITQYSVYLETLALINAGVLLVINTYVGDVAIFAFPGLNMFWLYTYIMVLLPDLIVRWDAVMRESQAYGFYEWLIVGIKSIYWQIKQIIKN
jgi:hypothetical protein